MRSFSEFFWVKMALSALIGCMIGLFPLFLDAIISIFRKKKNDFAHGADGPFKEYPPFLTQYENHILSREQQKMSDFIQHGIDGYHAAQAETSPALCREPNLEAGGAGKRPVHCLYTG